MMINKQENYYYSRSQYHMEGGVLYVEADKALCLIPPTCDQKHLFEEAHSGKFGAHLRDANVHGQLLRHYWWPRMRTDISGCVRVALCVQPINLVRQC